MVRVDRDGDLTAIWLSSWRSRLVGYGVHVLVWRGVLIDTGFPAARKTVRRLLSELRPRGAIVTHGHEDHAGNLEVVVEAGLPHWISPLSPDVMRASRSMAAYRRFTWGHAGRWLPPPATFDPSPLVPLHTPGHSVDHHIIWDPERETLFSADLFLGIKVRIARPEEDPRALVLSLRQAAKLEPRVMWDAHKGRIDEPVAALRAKADWIEELIGRIERRIRSGEPDEYIARAELGPPELVDRISRGDLSRVNLVRAIRGGPTRAA
jgi:glyoxylase-like metal-dependent hydrolase (beta-lactamase superfamily II)